MTGARPELAGLVLAAGAGTRLRPLSELRPKPLCPVGNIALLDLALARVFEALDQRGVGAETEAVAVNVCHGRAQLVEHLAVRWPDRVHLSVEAAALGTAGAVAPLRAWLAGRSLLIVNGDTWCPRSLLPFVDAWDGQRIAVAVSGSPPLHARSGIVASILPWADAATVAPEPAGLWERFWRDRLAVGRLQSVGVQGPFVDCATVADYLRANLAAVALGSPSVTLPPPAGDVEGQGERSIASLVGGGVTIGPAAVVANSVIGAGAVVDGRVERSVVWPGARVGAGERLVDCVRADGGVTVSASGATVPPPAR